MGFRTVVMLSNDMTHQWESDQELGRKIARAAHDRGRIDGYGQVVECVHGDCQTLAVIDGYTVFQSLAVKGWVRDESKEEMAIKLLKEAAEKLGYRLVKHKAKTAASQPKPEAK